MPLFHGNALNACVFPALRVGAMIALRRKFSASEFIDDVRANGCTYFSSIGRVLNYVLATPERPDDANNPLKLVLGPESSAADMVEFKRRFGCPVYAGYGSSENAIILLPAPGSARGALGVAPEGDDIAVLDSVTGEECPTALFDDTGKLVNGDEAIGELVGRNALERFEGYYNNADAGHDRSRNGWYWSGDLAYRDEAGIFWFAGRTADWIRVDGENFAAAPIERILTRFSGVRDAVVYGVPDERNAEDQVMTCLELSNGVDLRPRSVHVVPRRSTRPRHQVGTQVRPHRAVATDHRDQQDRQEAVASRVLEHDRSDLVAYATDVYPPTSRSVRATRPISTTLWQRTVASTSDSCRAVSANADRSRG